MNVEPVRTTPKTEPAVEPSRRLYPSRECPNQRRRLGETVRRTLSP